MEHLIVISKYQKEEARVVDDTIYAELIMIYNKFDAIEVKGLPGNRDTLRVLDTHFDIKHYITRVKIKR